MFEHIVAAPADPILGLNDAFHADTRDIKVNLGVGVFRDDQGTTPILASVKIAESRLLESEVSKGYLSISGLEAYSRAVRGLLFGEKSDLIDSGRAVTAQAPGGTGALRVGAEFLASQLKVKRVWISNPTWANHTAIFQAAGIECKTYRYYDAESQSLDFDGFYSDLKKVPAGDVVLLHGCCHNPTGFDPSDSQWQQLAALAQEKRWLPMFDFAYQGFAEGVEEDASGLRAFVARVDELLVASSFSKNFGLYNERVGALTLVGRDAGEAQTAFSQMKSVIRANYSNPPAHGALVVATILNDEALREQWLGEVADMRNRIRDLRVKLVDKLAELNVAQDFSFVLNQNGMFSFSGLNPAQVARLKSEYGIYMVSSGRINIAGISSANLDYLCDAIAAVC